MNIKNLSLLPIQGCLVRRREVEAYGVVEGKSQSAREGRLLVYWLHTQLESEIAVEDIESGFKVGMEVLAALPIDRGREEWIQGCILARRELAGFEQCLVEFKALNERRWLPYQYLRWHRGVKKSFLYHLIHQPHKAAERMRLRLLAQAIKSWNENTGALSYLDIDPLPHQIHLVHHILSSGNLNWLIADDVGLGKTIETGMLIHALLERDLARRILLITPAGLTRQWQEELYDKFKLDQFQIYGEQFYIEHPRHWKMYDFVIGSIDKLKHPEHLHMLLESEPWDLVIFDEAHRLSRRQYGKKLSASDRFKLARELRPKTKNIILLSATPHQGKQDQFIALLELLRPERRKELHTFNLHPEILKEMIFRNHKADVTDAEGNFIFKGTTAHAIKIPSTAQQIAFDKKLQHYLRQGYSAGSEMGNKGRAIGFVMTIYRKLAASSTAAIHRALHRRLSRLSEQDSSFIFSDVLSEENILDERYIGEEEESYQDNVQAIEFFMGERDLLEGLISDAKMLMDNDVKASCLFDQVIGAIHSSNPAEKLLIFTEYTATQSYLFGLLSERFGTNKVSLINGSMTHAERKAAIDKFEEEGLFLISTEAGGEGINLQRSCHIMVNYDLPWNPMRLVQRIGRLYRYGQAKKVRVFNFQQEDSLDQNIVNLMYERLERVVDDLAQVQEHEYHDGLKSEILGDFVEALEIESILKDAAQEGISRTKERIERALEQARESVEKQHELFSHAATSDPNELKHQLSITVEHLYSFLIGMLSELNIEIVKTTHNGKRIEIRLTEELKEQIGWYQDRGKFLALTFDRVIAANDPETQILSLDMPLMQFLLRKALEANFGGQTAAISSDQLQDGSVFGSLLRWQNPQGRHQRQEFAVIQVSNGLCSINTDAINQWLLAPAQEARLEQEQKISRENYLLAQKAAEQRLAQLSNQYLIPEGIEWLAAGWSRTAES